MKHRTPRLFGAATFVVAFAIAVAGRASAPGGRYTIGSDTVYDMKTKLTWQRGVSPSTYAQTDAASYCASLALSGAGWRLPKMKELITIVDFSVAAPSPTIDATAFPGTPADDFWSITPYAGAAGTAWFVSFNTSYSDYSAVSVAKYVRCVR